MSDVEDTGGASEVTPPVRIKEVGTTSVACPMLTQTNYTVWALRMKVVLRIHKVWSEIEPGTTTIEEKDCLAIGLIYQAIPEVLVMQIGDASSAKALWDAIKARHVGADRVKEARLQTLNTDFDRLRMNETESIDSFAGKLSGLASKSASLGETIAETRLVKKLLTVVPHRFIQIVASLEQVLDLKTVSFEDVVGRLKAYEERIRGDEGGDGQQQVLMARTGGGGTSGGGGGKNGGGGAGSSGEASGGTKGKWGRKDNRGGGFYQEGNGSGSGSSGGSGSEQAQQGNKPNFDDQPNSNKKCNCDCCEKNRRNPKNDRSKIVCYRCDKPGHYASECPERLEKSQVGDSSGGEDNDEPVF